VSNSNPATPLRGSTGIPPGERIVVEGGTAAAVIDLAGSTEPPPRRGGHDPFARQVFTRHQASGRLRIGHTADFADPGAPIIVREADDVLPGPDGTGFAEGRCRACIARPFLARGDEQTVLILQHQPGCPVLRQLLALAGAL
jgi:hypothetical protein